jgi:hypothetical protein
MPMEGPLTFTFLKDRYDRELMRKHELTSALNLPVGLLTLFGGLVGVMVREFSYTQPHVAYAFYSLLAIVGLAFVGCMVMFGLVFHRQRYQYLPLLSVLEESRVEFEAYYVHDLEQADEEFTAQVRRRIIDAADTNTKRNDEKSRSLYWGRVMLLVVLVASALSGIVFIVDQILVRRT